MNNLQIDWINGQFFVCAFVHVGEYTCMIKCACLHVCLSVRPEVSFRCHSSEANNSVCYWDELASKLQGAPLPSPQCWDYRHMLAKLAFDIGSGNQTPSPLLHQLSYLSSPSNCIFKCLRNPKFKRKRFITFHATHTQNPLKCSMSITWWNRVLIDAAVYKE